MEENGDSQRRLPSRGCRLRAGVESAYGHRFGGPVRHEFMGPGSEGLCVHLLYSLDLHDPRLELKLPGVQHLPLYYPFRHHASGLAYRVRTERTIQIITPPDEGVHRFWPYWDYPEHFPELPVELVPITYEEQKTLVFASVLPGALSEADQLLTDGYSQSFPQVEGWFNLMQDEPGGACPNPSCLETHLKVFVAVPDEPVPGLRLWTREQVECVVVLFQVCTRCGTVVASHETD